MIKLYMQMYIFIRLNNKLIYLYLFIYFKKHYENIICASE